MNATFTNFADRQPKEEFFNPDIRNSPVVSDAVAEYEEPLAEKSHIIEGAIRNDSADKSFKTQSKSSSSYSHNSMLNLSLQQKAVVELYENQYSEANILKTVVEAEAGDGEIDIKHTKHFSACQERCGERNKQAAALKEGLSSTQIKDCFGAYRVNQISYQSQKWHDHKILKGRIKNYCEICFIMILY
ncbi:MAG: hypothetical protein ACQEP8_04515 [Chlamydiota bacterium]